MVLVGFKPDLWRPTGFLQCFDTVGLVIWPVKIVPEMTCYVLSGMLNPTHSLRVQQRNFSYTLFSHIDIKSSGFPVIMMMMMMIVLKGQVRSARRSSRHNSPWITMSFGLRYIFTLCTAETGYYFNSSLSMCTCVHNNYKVTDQQSI